MIRLGAVFILFLLSSVNLNAQTEDILTSGDNLAITKFRSDLSMRFEFGKEYTLKLDESIEQFVERILGKNSAMYHGAFELRDFHNCIISFGKYEFEGTSVIIGILLEPTSKNGSYKLLKTLELRSGCGNDPEIKSVFLHNADRNSIGRELVIHGAYNCGRHGTFHKVYVYNGLVKSHKLVLSDYLSEHCDYREAKIGGEWDYDYGEEGVEERRYQKCIYDDYKAIKKVFDALNK